MIRALLIVALLVCGPVRAAPWAISPETSVTVMVPWRGLTVTMRFPEISGTVEFDERQPETARADVMVDARSVRTGLPPADRLARSEDFLAAAQYPSIRFRLERLVRTSPSTADVFGRITFRGTTKPIAFSARVFRYGQLENAPDVFEAGFQLDGAIDRTEFGSTGALGDVPAVLQIRIRLVMTSV